MVLFYRIDTIKNDHATQSCGYGIHSHRLKPLSRQIKADESWVVDVGVVEVVEEVESVDIVTDKEFSRSG